jgi:sugar O-acyltransferase (sialic acid O-acetyltransferase NeuD family)
VPGVSEPLVLVGAGGFGRETAEAVRAINAAHEATTGQPRWELRGFVDDDPGLAGAGVSGTRVLGPMDRLADHPDASVVLCTGHPGDFTSKRRIAERLALPAERYATLVHPRAELPESCRVGEGTVILAGVVATTDVVIGSHVGVMPQAVLTHDDRLDDYVTLGAGVRLAGTVRVMEGAYLGAGCLVRENVTIGPWALVGMGAIVTRDVPGREVWVGVPAAFVRAVEHTFDGASD